MKTLMILSAGKSVVNGVLHLVAKLMSVEVVDATAIISVKLGGKSLRRAENWIGGERLRPNGGLSSGSF